MPLWVYVFLGLIGIGVVTTLIVIAAGKSGYFMDDSFRWGSRDDGDRKNNKNKDEEG